MASILGAIIFGIIAVLTLLVTAGLPLGEFTLGGKYKILPGKMRIVSGISFLIQLVAIIAVLQAGEVVSFGVEQGIARGICYFFAAYLVLNSVMNFLSNSKKEKYVMTPLAIIAAICFFVTAITK